jgi:hypothetical protein
MSDETRDEFPPSHSSSPEAADRTPYRARGRLGTGLLRAARGEPAEGRGAAYLVFAHDDSSRASAAASRLHQSHERPRKAARPRHVSATPSARRLVNSLQE